MCGIAGFNLNPSEQGIDVQALTRELLTKIVARGRHATGMAYQDGSTYRVRKAPVSAYQFLPQVAEMPTGTRSAILHTRYATKGSPANGLNNHPIVSGQVIGVHNGVLHNDDALFRHLRSATRHAEVDSEAAFALIDTTQFDPADVLGVLEGRAALGWFQTGETDTLHLARVTDSPLAVGQTKAGSVVFASTYEMLLDATDRSKVDLVWADEIEEHTYIRVVRGVITDYRAIGDPVKAVA